MTLQGQTAIVTGATAGIGKAIAKRLAENGAYVAVVGTNAERGAQVVAELPSFPDNAGASFHQVDVSNYTDVEAFCKEILEKRGQVDILVNNAGITRDQLLMKMTEEDWNTVMDINVKSCYNTCRALVRSFVKARKGRIINITSVVGLTGNAGQVNYAASKAAIIGLTKSLAKELAARNILVNCIAPGYIATPMTDAMTEAQKAATLAANSVGPHGQPLKISPIPPCFWRGQCPSTSQDRSLSSTAEW